MKQQKKNEAGAIMVEILAVLALIGVMGPMLFRQVLDRNKEISNVNMASEMRTIKEAVSAYIAADGASLGRACLGESAGASSEPKYCNNINIDKEELTPFLPAGMDDVMDYYTVKSYAYWVDYGTSGSPDPRPFVYAMVVSNGDGQPQDWNFRRAARVASLIGADGAVVVDGDYTGTSGAWALKVIDNQNIGSDSVAVTTAFDTFEPDLGIVEPNAVYAPESLAFKKLHAWNYFSVGDKDDKTTGRCFQEVRVMGDDNTPKPDVIYGSGVETGKGPCDPFFWVGASGDAGDNSKAGHVYAKNNVYVGQDNLNNRAAIALEAANSETGATADEDRRIVVYDTAGKEKISIDATGRIIAGKTKQADVTVDGGTNTKKSYYGLDPANTSVLEDVRLGARGGARLSDILPNYIAKNVFTLENGRAAVELGGVPSPGVGSYSTGSTTSRAYWYIKQPSCPASYTAAVVLTPLKWKNTVVENIIVPGQSITAGSGGANTATHSLSVSGVSVTGTINVKDTTLTGATNIKQSRKDLYLNATVSGADFYIQAGYNTGSNVASVALPVSEIIVQAQTFCVYKGTKAKASDTLDVPPTNP